VTARKTRRKAGLISIAQKIQTLFFRVAASASEWRFVHSLALAATEKSRIQRAFV